MRATNLFLFASMLFCLLLPLHAARSQTVLVEAEAFEARGGWVVDQQFMDRMGSPFLLAHGMGRPVKDAVTTVDFPAAGDYRVWVRTWDWVSPWKAPGAPGRFEVPVNGAPGRFEVHVNGAPLEAVFGTEGDRWGWQDGGRIRVARGPVTLALHDLTGFEGRCDAVLFSADPGFAPPVDGPALAAFRKKALGLPDTPPDAGAFDLVVVGGGMAGISTAVSAARLGLKTALIQNRPVLGGNNSSEVRVHVGGKTLMPPYPELGRVVEEIRPERQGNARPAAVYEDGKKAAAVLAEKNVTLFLSMHVFAVEKDKNLIAAVHSRHIETGRELRFAAPRFADCTGDGNLGFLAGADFRMGREGRDETGESLAPPEADRMTMGASVMWYAAEQEGPSSFPECPWALAFTEESCQPVMMGEWQWETGMGRDQVAEFEYIRDYAFRAIYGNWAFLKNRSARKGAFANRALDWVAYIGGKRESRRLLGDVILKQQDIQEGRAFPDASVTTTWTIDLHHPDPENEKHFPDGPFKSVAKHARIEPYAIPYRCLYSRNVNNLFMAGRNISVTHVALGTVRVQGTTAMMGEVVGMAAAVCKEEGTTPRGVYQEHLEDLKALMKRGVGKAAIGP